MRYLQTLIVVCCTFLSLAAFAEDSLTVFKAGDRVKADEMNANFKTLADAIEEANEALADAVSFEGMEDVYGGLSEEEEEASNFLERATADVVPCSESDTSCVINGNRASVVCSAGETGKLKSVLESPYANAAFLLVEIQGECVEDNLLITRGAAFFSKDRSAKASITASTDTAATCIGHYCYFGNINVNGRLTAGRGASLILQENMIITDITTDTDWSPAIYAGEGAFLMFGSNLDIDGNIFAEGGASLAMYGAGNTFSQNLTLKGAEFVASGGGFKAARMSALEGARIQLKNGTFEIDAVAVSSGSNLSLWHMPQVPGGLTTNYITVSDGSHLRAEMYNGFDMTGAADGSFPDPGVLYIWDSSTAYFGYGGNVKLRGVQIAGGSLLRLAPVAGVPFEVDGLGLGYGSQITSNNSSFANIVVKKTLSADTNSFIQYGAVDASQATLDISKGCASLGLQGDLCE
jgi:hypothetical protein